MTKVIERPNPIPVIDNQIFAGINLDSLTQKYAVEAFNNDVSTFEDVAHVLTSACGYDKQTAIMYTKRIHREGKAVCYWNNKEKCETVISAFAKIGVKAELREV